MKIAHVEFDVEIPVDATDDEIEEWLRYEFRDKEVEIGRASCRERV